MPNPFVPHKGELEDDLCQNHNGGEKSKSRERSDIQTRQFAMAKAKTKFILEMDKSIFLAFISDKEGVREHVVSS